MFTLTLDHLLRHCMAGGTEAWPRREIAQGVVIRPPSLGAADRLIL